MEQHLQKPITAIETLIGEQGQLEKLTDFADTIQLQELPPNLKIKEFDRLAEVLKKIAQKLKLLTKHFKETNIYGESRIKSLGKTSKTLRTHLNGVIGSVRLVLDNFCDNPEEEVEYLQQCFDCSVKLSTTLEEFFNLLQTEKTKKLTILESKTQLLPIASEALRTHLNGMIGSINLVLDNLCDNREEEISNLHQCFDCSIKLLGVLEEFFNVLQEEQPGASQF